MICSLKTILNAALQRMLSLYIYFNFSLSGYWGKGYVGIILRLLYKEMFWLDKMQHMLKLYRGAMLISTLFSVCQTKRDQICRYFYYYYF